MEPKDEKNPLNETPAAEEKPSNGPDTPTAAAKPDAETRLLYMQAEFENTKKRLLRDAENSIKFGNEKLIRELLPIVSLFDRALEAAAPLKNATDKKPEFLNFLLGIEMTHRELTLTLERFGVEWIGKKAEKFNPERHEAISQLEVPDAEPGSVVQVVERGCLLNGRLLQPAKVVVAKAKE